ncbi:MAG: hypothetical protein ABIH23_35105 [bacterium]
MQHFRKLAVLWIIPLSLISDFSLDVKAADDSGNTTAAETTYWELIRFPGRWEFLLGRSHLILVTDEELEALSDPDKKINLSLGRDERMESLHDVCERARAAGHRTLIVAFDHFFSQYRPGQGDKPRRLMPDMDEYIQRIAEIGRFAENYGLRLELSLLSPLEIGPAYRARTGESGVWMHYRKGLRDPDSGAYSVQLWRQQRWANNKGPIDLEDAGVRVFAFKERKIRGTPYRVVNPDEIVDISDTAEVEQFDALTVKHGEYKAERIRIHGKGREHIGPLNRVLIVQQYRTPEMDYFSENALPFLTDLVDAYADAGVKLNALYSDEMHIQQDWHYFSHHTHGEFALRYVSDGFAKAFADRYGDEYRDFAKYLVYFTYGQEDFSDELDAKAGIMHVFGDSPEEIRRTALFRSRYYHFLQDGVVDLFVRAKSHADERNKRVLLSRAHATWAESPTIDYWDVADQNQNRNKYEYTSNFVWSNTVHQAASACYDYFAWGDFLTGNGNDHCECGWLDRNYVGLALACSTGILNDLPHSYGAHWGMPGEIARRRTAVQDAFGASTSPLFSAVQEMQHRDVDVLMLYPLDLVAVEERFGSWMNQYAYANYVTQAKFLERAKVVDGAVEMAGRRFTTLVATFEPFPHKRLLEMMRELAETGGRVIWSGPPPVLTAEGDSALEIWQDLCGVEYSPGRNEGVMVPGRQVCFEGIFSSIPPQVILTHFLVDRVYPVTPRNNVEIVARIQGSIAGTHRTLDGGGSVTFLGYRPRDDQSESLGCEYRNWFDILRILGAYPSTGKFPGVNDNTEVLSRTTDYICCRFPNGSVAIAPHLRKTEEDWEGGFARNAEKDQEYLKRVPPPSDEILLHDFQINGHTVSYSGKETVAFRVNNNGELIAFAGTNCREITVNGKRIEFADEPVRQIAWAPVANERRWEHGTWIQIFVGGRGEIRIPTTSLPGHLDFFIEGSIPGSGGERMPVQRTDDFWILNIDKNSSNRWIYGIESPK